MYVYFKFWFYINIHFFPPKHEDNFQILVVEENIQTEKTYTFQNNKVCHMSYFMIF